MLRKTKSRKSDIIQTEFKTTASELLILYPNVSKAVATSRSQNFVIEKKKANNKESWHL